VLIDKQKRILPPKLYPDNRTGATDHGHPLAAGENMTIADQFGGRVRSVTMVKQPAEFVGCGAQRRELLWAKELFVLGRWPAMGLMPRHAQRWHTM